MHTAKCLFAECQKKALGKDGLCRVPDKIHSAKPPALDKVPVSSSEWYFQFMVQPFDAILRGHNLSVVFYVDHDLSMLRNQIFPLTKRLHHAMVPYLEQYK